MIDERQKSILWLLVEDFFDIHPRECGVKKRDEIENFLSKVADVFDEERGDRDCRSRT